jgi:preprotein translocase subunit SecD
MKKKLNFFIVLAVTLFMVYLAAFGLKLGDLTIAGAPEIRFGIDIRGGVNATFQPEGLDRAPTTDELESAREIIEIRLDQQNILDRDVTIDKEGGYVIVNFPWKSSETDFNPEKAISELGAMAELTFQDSDGNVLVEGTHVLSAKPATDQNNQYVVALTFDEEGTKLFSES